MNFPLLERRRVKLTSGTTDTDPQTNRTQTRPRPPALSSSGRPFFTRQIDVIFPSSLSSGGDPQSQPSLKHQTESQHRLRTALEPLGACWYSGDLLLADVVSPAFVEWLFQKPERRCALLGTDAHNGAGDDAWCLETYSGMLTLSISKETYERLGLVGKRVPFKGMKKERFVINLPLRKNAVSVANAKRRDEMLKVWDARRMREGRGLWRVRCTGEQVRESTVDGSVPQKSPPPLLDAKGCLQVAHCQATGLENIRVPFFKIQPCPSEIGKNTTDGTLEKEDVVEDWHMQMAALFEWVGMVGLRSQRLEAYDDVNPYVSVYECPAPSIIGDVTHLRWRGFIHSEMVQAIIDKAIATVTTEKTNTNRGTHDCSSDSPASSSGPDTNENSKPETFVAIVTHAISASPVTRIDSVKDRGLDGIGNGHVRLPRTGGEDTWCLLMTPSTLACNENDGQKREYDGWVDWAVVESVGQYDTRWG